MTELVTQPNGRVQVQAGNDREMVALWLDGFRSANTRRAYQSDLQAFATFCQAPLHQVRLRDLLDYSASLGSLAVTTQGRRLSAVKSLFAFAHRLGYVALDVGAAIKVPAVKDTLASRIISEWDVQQLLGLERRPRNAALLRLLYIAGLRISEACGLCWRDLTARDNAGQITVFGKGGKTRMILLPAPLWARLLALPGAHESADPVFLSRQGGPLAASAVHRIVKAAAKRAKLPDSVSAHFLRHAHASHALDRGAPVHVVQATLGHASLATTTRYTHARPGDSSSKYLAT